MVAPTNIKISLYDLLGEEYVSGVINATDFLNVKSKSELEQVAEKKVEFCPARFMQRQDELLQHVGKRVIPEFFSKNEGASTASFTKAQNSKMSPLSGFGVIRIGENGKAYFIGKSEHYHASLGHHFPGFQLIENAKKIGVCNITHNNTRGYITRLLERELIRIANGLEREDEKGLERVLNSELPHVLNRVINLETGSLAVEAALKMMLARFYRLDGTSDTPQYSDRIPVFLVMADNAGGKVANYHGTTVLTQMLRGMWPDLAKTLEVNEQYLAKAVRINNIEHFNQLVGEYDTGKYKVAGFFHELVLMNYGGIRLTEEFVQSAHTVCSERDIPVIVDEIQSCMWSPELFMFKEYALKPDFVAIGKGFPGGQYPASKILTTATMDNLNQFGALVTNGQEELASLAYLITMRFAETNREYTKTIGKYYHQRAIELAERFPKLISSIEGEAHMTTFFFHTAEQTTDFTGYLNQECCIDISAQTYKENCPPAALTKLPIVTSRPAVDFVINKMTEALLHIQKNMKQTDVKKIQNKSMVL